MGLPPRSRSGRPSGIWSWKSCRGFPSSSRTGGWSLLVVSEQLGLSAAEFSRRLPLDGRIAATPMSAWGKDVASRYVRMVFATEPVERLRGIGERVRAALHQS